MAEPVDAAAQSTTEDGFLGGRLRLRQPVTGHRAGHDAILLAASTRVRAGDRVVEFGTGVGAAGLAVASRGEGIVPVLVEIDPDLAALARDNVRLNELAAEVVCLDVTGPAEAFAAVGLGPDSADVVLMNPPFHDAARHRASPDPARQRAHLATATTLEAWVHAARRLLKSGGTLTLIWRADGLADVLAALDRGFGSVMVQAVHGQADKPAIRILVRATKGGRTPLILFPGLLLNDSSSQPSAMAQSVLAGEQLLPLGQF
ncbi:methyltransferase [Rubrivivax sp. JA1024]|nr:methyltransferase [Rubrivivax sp. JA1024]